MQPPPDELDGARVCYFAEIDGHCRATGNCKHYVGGNALIKISALAICQYKDDQYFYLFYCGDSWEVLADTWHESLERARKQAEFEYEGVEKHWRKK